MEISCLYVDTSGADNFKNIFDLVHDKRRQQKTCYMGMKILRNIYGSVYNDNQGIYEKRHNEELYGLYEKLNIPTYYIRRKRLKWLRHVWRADGDV